jgi:hypothetical protein
VTTTTTPSLAANTSGGSPYFILNDYRQHPPPLSLKTQVGEVLISFSMTTGTTPPLSLQT